MPAKAGGPTALAAAPLAAFVFLPAAFVFLPAAFAFASSAHSALAAPPTGPGVGVVERQPAARPSLVEAAKRQRERVAESRSRHGAAPRFTDADLPGRAAAGGGPAAPDDRERIGAGEATGSGEDPEGRSGPAGTRSAESEAAGAEEPGSPPREPAAGEPPPERAETAEERKSDRERERELRERLLEVEASLAALGVSGLPYAPRNPNRFTSAFDAARLQAEQREIRRELRELEAPAGRSGARPR